jgi:uncharacterized protein (UPF0332 family)
VKDVTVRLLDKATRAISTAERVLQSDDPDVAAGRAYYAMFYMAEALLHEQGLRFKKHGGVHAAFGEHFVKPGLLDAKYHRWLLAAFEKRITADYGVEEAVTADEADVLIRQAREFLQTARQHLAGGR